MKKILFITILVLLAGHSAYAELYRIHVKRIDSNLYKDTNSGLIIETKYCYHYTYGEEAVLKYDKYSYDNKIIFNSSTSCEVKNVHEIKQNAAKQYEIEVAHNDELFIINDERFEAKLYCFGWYKGDKIIFLDGNPNGVCTSATLYNITRDKSCEVWCE